MKPHMLLVTARENLHLAGLHIERGMGERAAGRPEAAHYDDARALIEDVLGDLVVLRNALQAVTNEKPAPVRCDECSACVTERIGCACDGALDDGCFFCTPDQHERPPCPPGNYPTRAREGEGIER